MTFINPILFSVGAACVAIPILVHLLLRRRRRPIPWAAMRFLLEAYKQQRRRMKLEQILLLAARCLLILLVALAVGRPILAGASGFSPRAPRELFILIDNSLTSGVTTGTSSAEGTSSTLEMHKKAAAELVRTLDASRGDRVALVTLAGPAESVVLPPSTDLASLGTLISNLRPSDSAADWEGAAALVSPHVHADPGQEPPIVAIFSGFRQGSADVSVDPSARVVAPGESDAEVRVIAVLPDAAPASNTSIVGADLLEGVLIEGSGSETGTASARVQLARSGELPEATASIRAWIADRDELPPESRIGRETVSWARGERDKAVIVRTPLGTSRAARPLLCVAIDQDAVDADNIFRRPVVVREQLRVAIVGVPGARSGLDAGASLLERFNPADWTALALEPREDDPVAGARSEIAVAWTEPAGVGTLDADQLDAVVLTVPHKILEPDWRHLADLRARGVVIVVVPPPDEKVHLWTDAMRGAFSLDWEFDREATDFDPPRAMVWEGKPRPSRDLFAQIGGEMAELSRAVSVSKMLRMSSATADVQVWAGDERSESPLVLSAARVPWRAARSEPREPGSAARETGEAGAAPAQGALVVFATSLDLSWTTLPARPLMVPLMQEIVRQGVGVSSAGRAAVAGGRIPTPGGASQLRPLTPSRQGVLSVAPDGLTTGPVRNAGAWLGVDDRGATLAKSGLLAVNPDPRAGRVVEQPRESVQRWLAAYCGLGALAGDPSGPEARFRWLDSPQASGQPPSPGGRLLETTSRTSPWSLPLFAAALCVGLAELVMARMFSHAYAGDRGGRAAA